MLGQQGGVQGAQISGYPTSLEQSTQRDNIGTILNEIDAHLDRLAKVANTLTAIGDGIEGSKPREVGQGGKPDAPPNSLIDMLRRKTRSLSSLLDQCEWACNRIQASIG